MKCLETSWTQVLMIKIKVYGKNDQKAKKKFFFIECEILTMISLSSISYKNSVIFPSNVYLDHKSWKKAWIDQ